MRTLKYIIFAAATLLVAASCWKDDKHRNKYSFALDCDFEYRDVTFGDDSVFVVQNIGAGSGLVCFAAKVEDDAFQGGFCLAGGVDPDLSEGHESKTPFHTVAHQYFKEESTFAVFRESDSMPEKMIWMTLFNDDCSFLPQALLVNNTHRFVMAARYGAGLAGGPFTAEDWAAVTLTGYLKGAQTGEVKILLADMSKEEKPILTTWETVDLTALGSVDEVRLAFSSSREDMVKDVCFDHIVFQSNIEY